MTMSFNRMKHLEMLVENLFHNVVHKNCEVSKEQLNLLHSELTQNVEYFLTDLYWITVISITFIQGNHQKVMSLISSGSFGAGTFVFLRRIYKNSEKIINPQVSDTTLVKYPSSIDPRDSDGISESVEKYLREVCVKEKEGDVKVDAVKIAEEAGINVSLVTKRIQHHRNVLTSVRATSSNKNQKKEFGGNRCSPLSVDMFPLHRVPLSEPLTIQIP